MTEEDNIKLLRECNAGIKMGVESIDKVLPKVKSSELRGALEDCRHDHSKLGDKTHRLLNEFGDGGKEINPIVKGMASIKTNVRLAVDDSDETVADIITEGCNTGIKSLRRYLNQYKAAEEETKSIAKELVSMEENLVSDVKSFL